MGSVLLYSLFVVAHMSSLHIYIIPIVPLHQLYLLCLSISSTTLFFIWVFFLKIFYSSGMAVYWVYIWGCTHGSGVSRAHHFAPRILCTIRKMWSTRHDQIDLTIPQQCDDHKEKNIMENKMHSVQGSLINR